MSNITDVQHIFTHRHIYDQGDLAIQTFGVLFPGGLICNRGLFGKVTFRKDWLRKRSTKQGFRNNVKCINHKKQGFRIVFDRAFVSIFTKLSYQVTGLRNNFDRIFVLFLRDCRNVKGFSMIFS